jgi:hypothetical protein
MSTIETALRSYRYLLKKHHPTELKQLALVNAALIDLGVEVNTELKPLAPLCSVCRNPVATPVNTPEIIGEHRCYDSEVTYVYGSVKPHCPFCGRVFVAL